MSLDELLFSQLKTCCQWKSQCCGSGGKAQTSLDKDKMSDASSRRAKELTRC